MWYIHRGRILEEFTPQRHGHYRQPRCHLLPLSAFTQWRGDGKGTATYPRHRALTALRPYLPRWFTRLMISDVDGGVGLQRKAASAWVFAGHLSGNTGSAA